MLWLKVCSVNNHDVVGVVIRFVGQREPGFEHGLAKELHQSCQLLAQLAKKKKRTSLKSILGGDILATDFFRRQTKLLVLIMVFIIFYIHNRYASQQQQIEIDKLKQELIDIKYDALTRSSELMEKSRQSRIEDYISSKESDLQTSTNPPYLIK